MKRTDVIYVVMTHYKPMRDSLDTHKTHIRHT